MQHLIKLIKNKKSHKTIYYIKQVVWSYLVPRSFKLNYKKKLYKLLNDKTSKIIFDRVNYYNKMSNSFSLPDEGVYPTPGFEIVKLPVAVPADPTYLPVALLPCC